MAAVHDDPADLQCDGDPHRHRAALRGRRSGLVPGAGVRRGVRHLRDVRAVHTAGAAGWLGVGAAGGGGVADLPPAADDGAGVCDHHQQQLRPLPAVAIKHKQADEEIRTLDPLLGKEMLYH